MSVYRDSRYDDTRSVASGRTTGGTKITRYVVKEDESDKRSRFDDRSRAALRYDDRRTEIDVIDDRERTYSRVTEREPHRHTRETITIRRDESPDRRESYWNRPAGEDVQDRELVIRSSESRAAPSRAETRKESMAVSRVDDRRESRFSDYEVVSPQRDAFDEREREVQRYIRQTDYYQNAPQQQQQQQPQTIIIRQEPIIIRETVRDRPREEDFQIVKRSDLEVDERPASRRSRSEPRDEEYFYEKRVRERLPEDDPRERRMRRPVSPRDSVSQAGRRGGYESDDSMVYVRKETRETESRSPSPHKRSLAAGALAGVGAAELIRNHNRKEGKETSSGGGRLIKDAGAGIVGAVAAEAIRRYRSKSRHGSRSRSGSRDRYSRYSHRGRDRSRSESSSGGNKLGTVGGLGLAAAAVAVGAMVASRHKKDASPEGRRSRSRTRRSGSRSRSRADSRASSVASLANDPTADDDRNPKNRNKKTAAAGALGAAAMALYERHRSKSRGRRHSESPNRLKQGLPIALGGLAAAGLAHQFEKRRAKEEAEVIVDREQGRGRDARSRSRSRADSRARADSTYYDGPSHRSYSDPNLIQYGNEPLYGNNYGEGYYGRPGAPEQDYYQNQHRDMVPAGRRSSEARMSRSVSSSRSRSRSRGAAAAAAAAGAGIAASEMENRRREKKERRRRSRRRSETQSTAPYPDDRSRTGSYAPYTAGRDPYEDANWHATHRPSYDPYASQTGFGQFPPPPGAVPQPAYTPQPQANPSYAPQDFPPPPAGAPQAQQGSYNPYAPNQNPYAPRGRPGDENVSAAPFPASIHPVVDGMNAQRELAISPPLIGPNVTIQRPSVSTPVQPGNRFPGDAAYPFQPPGHFTDPEPGDSSSTASPGTRPDERSPIRPTSRAANAYTPPSQPARQERDRSTSQQSSRRPTPQTQERSIPVVTDAPTPVQNRRPQNQAEDPRVTAFRQAAYAAPSPNPPNFDRSIDRSTSSPQIIAPTASRAAMSYSPQPQSDSSNTGNAQPRQPEMKQTGGFAKPFMPSPDIRPPSDDYLPQLYQPSPFYARDNAPSMPALNFPEQPRPSSSSYIPPTGEQPERRRERDRSRSRSQSVPRQRSPSALISSATTIPEPQAPTATRPSALSRKKSVTFNPELDFSEAPTPTPDRGHRDNDSESPDVARHRRNERERDPDRDRDRERRRRERDYDAGDDLSDDTPFEDHRRRGSQSERDRDRDKDRDRGARHSSRRERSNTQSLDRASGSARDKDREPKRSSTMNSSSNSSRRTKDKTRGRDVSPTGSDETVDLPERFDERGRPKRGTDVSANRSPEQDLIAESLDQILGGLGLFGGSDKKKKR